MSTDSLQSKLAQALLQTGSLDRRIGTALDLALQFMQQSSPEALIEHYLGAASAPTLLMLKRAVFCLDHTGLITPAKTDARELNAIADRHGFIAGHKTFPSVIVASELTALNGGVPVPTQIFRAATTKTGPATPAYGIEMFVPDTLTATVDRWITRGVGTHAAFRVRERSDVDLIRLQLIAAGFHTPAFMGDRSMANTNDGTLTVYFDLNVPDGTFRLEFFHRTQN